MIFPIQEPIRQVVVSLFFSILLATGLIVCKYIFKKKINLLALLILVSILPIISIFRPGTYESGDLTLHTAYLRSFFENIQNGILIPQWAGGLCGGYGCPVFMFEYTFPFYIGSIFHLLGFSFLDSMKLFLASSFIASAIAMYCFVKDEYNDKAAFVASLLYAFAPMHFIETHFRVSVGSVASFIFIPLAFLFAKKSLEGKPIYIILGAVNFLFLILSHSSIAFIIIPASFVYAFLKTKKLTALIFPIISLLLGAGLSAFYVLPALFEIKYTWYSFLIQHLFGFLPFLYYLYSPARFGLLFQGNHGEFRLIVGYTQLFVVILAVFQLIKNRFKQTEKKILIFLLLFFAFCFTLMLGLTKPIWENVFFLKSFIIPWRMLVPIAFATAFIGAIVTKKWNQKLLIMFCVVTVMITILNWGNRKMVPFDSNSYYRVGVLYSEYVEPNNPIYASRFNERMKNEDEIVLHRPKNDLEILSGSGTVKEILRTQIEHKYVVSTDNELMLSENTYYFPGWKIYVNGKQTNVDIQNSKKFGTQVFTLKKGLYIVKVEFEDTTVRMFGKFISSVTIFGIFILFLKEIRSKKLRRFLPKL